MYDHQSDRYHSAIFLRVTDLRNEEPDTEFQSRSSHHVSNVCRDEEDGRISLDIDYDFRKDALD